MAANDKVQIRIKRAGYHGENSRYETYDIPKVDGMTVLEGLWHIVDNIDGSLAFRYSCRGAVCGSCAMQINGVITLACHTQISTLTPGAITIKPLPYFPIIKDLIVEMDAFYEKYKSVKPYFSHEGSVDKESIQRPADRLKIEKGVTCILCAACHSYCPLTAMNEDYLGPAALTAANRFAFDTRNEEGEERLEKINDLGDFGGCMKISRCSKVCPREIEPSERIDEIKTKVSTMPSYPDVETIKTVCGYCSTGCGFSVELRNKNCQKLTTDSGYPVNMGQACPKGWDAMLPLKAKDRALKPAIKNSKGELEEVEWDKAVDVFVSRFKEVQDKYGKDSVAFLSTGQMLTEEMAFLGSLAKFGMGLIHGDGNTRQCMATAAVAYKQSFGFDAPPYTYKDFEESDVMIFVGANPFISHPIMWERACLNKNEPVKVVIDPRRTETALWADKYYSVKPKLDASLFYCLAGMMIKRGAIDIDYIKKNTEGFDEFKEFVKKFTPEEVSKSSGLSLEEINELAGIIQNGKKVSFWWTMGVNQSYMGVRTAQAIINLALITGNIGRPGTGPNSITGQCNAMGSRLFSNTTSLLGGHDFTNPAHREKIADIMGIGSELVPTESGWSYDRIVEGIAEGKIKGLWIIATNPAHSWINHSNFKELLGKLDFCVVQDMFSTTETVAFADLLLPAAGWGEKTGTFINSERRFALINKLVDPPGESKSDFDIFKLIADKWGCGKLFEKWNTTEDVFNTMKKATEDTPCDITGIEGYKMIEDNGGIQWPFKKGTSAGDKERRLFEDGKFYTPSGKAKLIFEEPKTSPDPVTREFPFTLLTGRGSVAQFHTQTRTSKSERLRKIYPESVYMEINPVDAEKLNIKEDDVATIFCCRGEIKVKACLTYDVQEGQIFVPMHYVETNDLTFPAFDPYSKQPSYKECAVNVRV